MSKQGMKRPGSDELAKKSKGAKRPKNQVPSVPQTNQANSTNSMPGMCNCKGLDSNKNCGGGCGK